MKLYGEDGALLEPAHLTAYDGPIEESGDDEELDL